MAENLARVYIKGDFIENKKGIQNALLMIFKTDQLLK